MENINLGGNIQLSGFGNLDEEQLLIVKKMVGQFVKRVDSNKNTSRLQMTLKGIHATEGQKPKKYELHGLLDLDGKITQTESIDYNFLFVLNNVLKKLEQ